MGQSVKRIAIVCSYELLPERIGGMDYFFWMFDQKCNTNGIQVDWFFPNESRHNGYSELTIFSSDHQNVEEFFYNYCLNNKPLYTNVFTHFVELCTPIFKKIKKETKAKIIAVDHNPRPIEGYPLKIKIKKRLKGLLYIHYTDVFVSVSEYSRENLIREFGSSIRKKTLVIFNGIEIEKFKKKINFEFKGKFIVASHLRFEKGIQDLIIAVKELVKEADYQFTIDLYGSGVFKDSLQDMVKKYKLEKYFIFKGSVANLHELYTNYDYLIHPSHGETFCYSVIESLLSNLPVITTKEHGNVLGMVLENENGFLFEREDTQGLKVILSYILNQKKGIKDCTEVNKAVNRFSLETMVDNYLNLLQ